MKIKIKFKRVLSYILTTVMLTGLLSAYTPTAYADDGLGAALSVPTEAHAPIVDGYDVTFTISAPGQTSMSIRGDFQANWGWESYTMNRIPGTDLFTITLPMLRGDGIYKYGFVPGSNSSVWLDDPNDEGRRAGNSWFCIGDVPVKGYNVNNDGTVTFKVNNNSDSNVWITGDFLEATKLNLDNWATGKPWGVEDLDQVKMEALGSGDFEYTVAILPGVYAYKYYSDTQWFTGAGTYVLGDNSLLVVPGVIISEPESFKNPGEHSFSAELRRKDAFIDKNPDVTWSIKGTTPTGFSIDAQSGVVTTTNRAEAGQITVVAAWEDKTYEKTADYSIEPAFTYTIEHNVLNNAYTFADAQEEYGMQTPLTVTIKNTGTGYLAGGTIALTSGEYFTLSKTSLAEIDSESNDTFTVSPKTGLSNETYTDTVTVTGMPGDEPIVFTVSFTVAKVPVLGGTASISGINQIGQQLSISTTDITGGSGTFNYQWKANGAEVGTNSDSYTIRNADVGKTITCIVTQEDAEGSVIAEFDSRNTVPYNIELIKVGDTGTDNVTLSTALGRVDDKITLDYILEGSSPTNILTFTGASELTGVDVSGTGSQEYTVTADDAENGVITITATFQHTSLTLDPIAFETQGNILKIYNEGDLSFTNAITNAHSGTGQITYISSHQNVAMVDDDGKVTIIAAGRTTITATKAADETYAQAIVKYTLTINKAGQDAPVGVVGVEASGAGVRDGRLTDMTADMEYRLSTDENYTPVTGTEVTGLASGTYHVRYKAKTNYNASPDTVVTIGVRKVSIMVVVIADPAAGGAVIGAGIYDHNDDVTLVANPTAGYSFDGWYEDAGRVSTNLTYNFKATVGRTLTARFLPDIYNISYILGGGSQSGAPAKYTYGVGVTLKTPVRTGYTFDGWYTNSRFTGTKISSISNTALGGITLYAKWATKTYAITYKLNKGKQASRALTRHTYGKVSTLKKPTRTGYTFSGWYTKSKLTGKAVTSIAANTAKSTTLYAKWTPKKYRITYKLNKGKQASSAPTRHTYGKLTRLKSPTRAGYKFAGWYTNKNFTSKKVTSISKTRAKELTLYAKWIRR